MKFNKEIEAMNNIPAEMKMNLKNSKAQLETTKESLVSTTNKIRN